MDEKQIWDNNPQTWKNRALACMAMGGLIPLVAMVNEPNPKYNYTDYLFVDKELQVPFQFRDWDKWNDGNEIMEHIKKCKFPSANYIYKCEDDGAIVVFSMFPGLYKYRFEVRGCFGRVHQVDIVVPDEMKKLHYHLPLYFLDRKSAKEFCDLRNADIDKFVSDLEAADYKSYIITRTVGAGIDLGDIDISSFMEPDGSIHVEFNRDGEEPVEMDLNPEEAQNVFSNFHDDNKDIPEAPYRLFHKFENAKKASDEEWGA